MTKRREATAAMTRAMPSSAIWAVPPVRGRAPFVAATGVVKLAPEVTLASLIVAPSPSDRGHAAEQAVQRAASALDEDGERAAEAGDGRADAVCSGEGAEDGGEVQRRDDRAVRALTPASDLM